MGRAWGFFNKFLRIFLSVALLIGPNSAPLLAQGTNKKKEPPPNPEEEPPPQNALSKGRPLQDTIDEAAQPEDSVDEKPPEADNAQDQQGKRSSARSNRGGGNLSGPRLIFASQAVGGVNQRVQDVVASPDSNRFNQFYHGQVGRVQGDALPLANAPAAQAKPIRATNVDLPAFIGRGFFSPPSPEETRAPAPRLENGGRGQDPFSAALDSFLPKESDPFAALASEAKVPGLSLFMAPERATLDLLGLSRDLRRGLDVSLVVRDGHEASIEDLSRMLEGRDPANRRKAKATLAELAKRDPDAVRALISGLKSGDAKLRLDILESLGELNLDAKTALPALAGFLVDSSHNDPGSLRTRSKAAELALGLVSSAHPVALLIPALDHPDQNVRALASKALESFAKGEDPAAAISFLRRAARSDPSETAQLLAVSLLARLAPENAAAVEGLLEARKGRVGVQLAAEAALNLHAADIVPILARLLERDPRTAAKWLTKSPEGEKVLLDYAADTRNPLSNRLIAAQALDLASFHAKDPESVEKLIPLFQQALRATQYPKDAEIAADGLSRMGGAAAANVLLLTQRENPSAQVRSAAALALSRAADPRIAALAVDGLVEAAKTRSLAAFQALAKLAPDQAAPLVKHMRLEDLAKSQSPELKSAVEELLLAELKAEDPARRGEAAYALSYMQPFPKVAAASLIEALSDKDKTVRQKAARALAAAAGSQEAVSALALALKDGDPEVRGYAVDSLEGLARTSPSLDYGAAVDALTRIIAGNGGPGNAEVPLYVLQRNAASALRKMGKQAEPALEALEKLSSARGDFNTRAEARRAAQDIKRAVEQSASNPVLSPEEMAEVVRNGPKAEDPSSAAQERASAMLALGAKPETRDALIEAALGEFLSKAPKKKFGLSDLGRVVWNALNASPLDAAERVRHWNEAAEEALKQDANLAWYQRSKVMEKDGEKHVGFASQAKDGTLKFVAEDGFYALMTPDGTREVGNLKTGKFVRTDSIAETVYNPAAESFTRTPHGGQPDIFWDPGGAEGGISGSFYNHNFHLKPGEVPWLLDGKLHFSRLQGNGEAAVTGWMEKDEQGTVRRYEILPNGIGLIRDGSEIILSPAILPALRAGAVDLSGIPEDKLPRRYGEALEKALRAYPTLFPDIDAAFRGNVEPFMREGLTYERKSSVAGMQLVYDEHDNKYRLQVQLSQGTTARIDGKGERKNSQFFIEALEDGGARIFRPSAGTLFLHHFDPTFERMTVLVPDEETLKKTGAYRFRSKEKWAVVDGQWEKQSDTGVMEVDLNPSWLRRGLDLTMEGVDKLTSPIQNQLYLTLSGVTKLIGDGAGLLGYEDREAMLLANAALTLAQAKGNYLGNHNPFPFGPQAVSEYQVNKEMYETLMERLNPRQQERVRSYVGEKTRKEQADKMGQAWFMSRDEYRLGQNDPLSEARLIEAAAGQFGAANVPKQFMESGQEAWKKKNWGAAAWDYVRGGAFILGEGYVEGAGLGLLTSPAKLVAAGGRLGRAAETLEQAAVIERRVQKLSRAEMALFGGNTALQATEATVHAVQAALEGKSDLAALHFNEAFQHVAGGIGLLGGLASHKPASEKGKSSVAERAPEGIASKPVSRKIQGAGGDEPQIRSTLLDEAAAKRDLADRLERSLGEDRPDQPKGARNMDGSGDLSPRQRRQQIKKLRGEAVALETAAKEFNRFLPESEIVARFGVNPADLKGTSLGGTNNAREVDLGKQGKWAVKSWSVEEEWTNQGEKARAWKEDVREAQNELFMREIIKKYFPDFETPEAIAYISGNKVVIMSRYVEGVHPSSAEFRSLTSEQKAQLSILIHIFGWGDPNFSNFLFGGKKPVLVDFSAVGRDHPSRLTPREARDIQELGYAPETIGVSPQDIGKFMKEREKWAQRLDDSRFQEDLKGVLRNAGLTEPEINKYLDTLSQNLGNFEHNINQLVSAMAPQGGPRSPRPSAMEGGGSARKSESVDLHIGGQHRGGDHLISGAEGPVTLQVGSTVWSLNRNKSGQWEFRRLNDGGGGVRTLEMNKPFVIGRKSGDYRFPSEDMMSSQHMELVASEDGVLVRDLDSTNGTKIRYERAVAETSPARSQAEGQSALSLLAQAEDTVVNLLAGKFGNPEADIPSGSVKEQGSGKGAVEVTTAYDKPGRPIEDGAHVDAKGRFILVADGMGGPGNGVVAKGIFLDSVQRYLDGRITSETTPERAKTIVQAALMWANQEVLQYMHDHPETKGMGTTGSVGVVVKGEGGESFLVTGNVGNSGIFVRRANGRLERITLDESLSAQFHKELLNALEEAGVDMERVRRTHKVSAEDLQSAKKELDRLLGKQMSLYEDMDALLAEAMETGSGIDLRAYEYHPIRNVVTNSIGRAKVGPDNIRVTPLQPGDVVLGLSDGVIDNLGAARMAAAARVAPNPTDLVQIMIDESKRIALNPRETGKGAREQNYSHPDDMAGAALIVGDEVPTYQNLREKRAQNKVEPFSAKRGQQHVQEMRTALAATLQDPVIMGKIARYMRANASTLARNTPELKRLQNMTGEQLASELQAALKDTPVRYATPEDALSSKYAMGYNSDSGEILVNARYIDEHPDIFSGALLHELLHHQYPELGEMFAHRVEVEHYRYKAKGSQDSGGSAYDKSMETRSGLMRSGDYTGQLSQYKPEHQGPDGKLRLAKNDLSQKEWLLSVVQERQRLMKSGEWDRMSEDQRTNWIESQVRFRDEGLAAERNQKDIQAYRDLVNKVNMGEVTDGYYAELSMPVLMRQAKADAAQARREVASLRGELLWQRISSWLPASLFPQKPPPKPDGVRPSNVRGSAVAEATSLRHYGADPEAHLKLLEEHDLLPNRHSVQVGEAEFTLSDLIDIGDGRVGAFAKVRTADGEEHLRFFWRSNSQGNFRVLPAWNDNIPGVSFLDKGGGIEHALSVPSPVEMYLASQLVEGKVRSMPRAQAEALVKGAVRVNETREQYDNYRYANPDHIRHQTKEAKELLTDSAGDWRFKTLDRNGRFVNSTAKPESSVVRDPKKKPNYDKLKARYKTFTETDGEVEALVYESMDGKLEYTLHKDSEGMIRPAKVVGLEAPINSFGVPAEYVDAGDLVTPRWEYPSQIPPGFEGPLNPRNPHYRDAWDYLRRMPDIRQWYISNGLPIPESKSWQSLTANKPELVRPQGPIQIKLDGQDSPTLKILSIGDFKEDYPDFARNITDPSIQYVLIDPQNMQLDAAQPTGFKGLRPGKTVELSRDNPGRFDPQALGDSRLTIGYRESHDGPVFSIRDENPTHPAKIRDIGRAVSAPRKADDIIAAARQAVDSAQELLAKGGDPEDVAKFIKELREHAQAVRVAPDIGPGQGREMIAAVNAAAKALENGAPSASKPKEPNPPIRDKPEHVGGGTGDEGGKLMVGRAPSVQAESPTSIVNRLLKKLFPGLSGRQQEDTTPTREELREELVRSLLRDPYGRQPDLPNQSLDNLVRLAQQEGIPPRLINYATAIANIRTLEEYQRFVDQNREISNHPDFLGLNIRQREILIRIQGARLGLSEGDVREVMTGFSSPRSYPWLADALAFGRMLNVEFPDRTLVYIYGDMVPLHSAISHPDGRSVGVYLGRGNMSTRLHEALLARVRQTMKRLGPKIHTRKGYQEFNRNIIDYLLEEMRRPGSEANQLAGEFLEQLRNANVVDADNLLSRPIVLIDGPSYQTMLLLAETILIHGNSANTARIDIRAFSGRGSRYNTFIRDSSNLAELDFLATYPVRLDPGAGTLAQPRFKATEPKLQLKYYFMLHNLSRMINASKNQPESDGAVRADATESAPNTAQIPSGFFARVGQAIEGMLGLNRAPVEPTRSR